MGRFSKLLQNKGKEVKIGEEVFTIKPLTGKYMGLFMEMDGKKNEATMELILVSLQQTDKDLKLEDIKELPLGILTEIIETISEVNELK